jgi:hypothetical protein
MCHLTEEESLSGATIDEVLIWGPQNLHDTRQLLLLIFTRKDRESRIELGEDATQTPHVNSHVIVHAQDNFRRPIETALDISIDYAWLSILGTTVRINSLFSCSKQLLPKSITLMALFAGCRNNTFYRVIRQRACNARTTNLWLEIAMHYAMMPH